MSDRRPAAFSLLELMVATTLMAMAIGIATVNGAGMSEAARTGAAARKIGAVYRMAMAGAARSGFPHRVVLGERSCEIWRPEKKEGDWRWRTVLHEEYGEGVGLSSAAQGGAELMVDGKETDRGLYARPGPPYDHLMIELSVWNRRKLRYVIEAPLGTIRRTGPTNE